MKKPDVVTEESVGEAAFNGNPEVRCDARCLHGKGHAGPHLLDDESESLKVRRKYWELKLVRELEALQRKPGRPTKLSQHETVSDLAERFGVGRSTLYRFEREYTPGPLEKRTSAPATTEEKAIRSINNIINNMGKWATKAASIDIQRLAENRLALQRCFGIVVAAKIDIEKLGAALQAAIGQRAKASQLAPANPALPAAPGKPE